MHSALVLVNDLSYSISGLAAAPSPTPAPGAGGLPDPGNTPVVSLPAVQTVLFAALGIAIVFLAVKMGFGSDKDKPKHQLEKLGSVLIAVFTAVVGIGVTTIALWGQQILAFFTKA